MTAEQDGLDLAKVQAEHAHMHNVFGQPMHWCAPCDASWPCLPYRLAALALDLQGKVARVAYVCETSIKPGAFPQTVLMHAIFAALVDPTPTATCPKVSPLEALTDQHCTRPEGHAGGCLFVGRDGRTPLEVMPK